MAKAREAHRGICPYCAREKNLTREHVFPTCLFREPRQQPLIIHICYQCNQSKSPGDRDLRNFCTLYVTAPDDPITHGHLDRMLEHEATREWLRRVIVSTRTIDLEDEVGRIVGVAHTLDFNLSRALTSLELMARGLHFGTTQEMLPPDLDVRAALLPWLMIPHLATILPMSGMDLMISEGDGVASAMRWTLAESEAGLDTVWLLTFNRGVMFLVGTGTAVRPIDWLRERTQESDRVASIADDVDMPAIRLPNLPDGSLWIPPQ